MLTFEMAESAWICSLRRLRVPGFVAWDRWECLEINHLQASTTFNAEYTTLDLKKAFDDRQSELMSVHVWLIIVIIQPISKPVPCVHQNFHLQILTCINYYHTIVSDKLGIR